MYTLAGLMVVASLAHARVKFPYVPLADRKSDITIDVEGKERHND